jgi:hypothetical protein
MTDDDIKLAGELAKAATDSALEPIKEQVTNVFSPFTKEIGLLIALPAQLWRLKAKVIIAEKAMKFLNDRGVKAQQVPIKFLSPIMDYGCLEDDGEMQDRWAALLASAADPNYKQPILPSFPDILRQLSSKEAAILEKLYGAFIDLKNYYILEQDVQEFSNILIPIANNFDKLNRYELEIAIDNLERLALLTSIPMSSTMLPPESFYLTRLGFAFVSACRSPGEADELWIKTNIGDKALRKIGGPKQNGPSI